MHTPNDKKKSNVTNIVIEESGVKSSRRATDAVRAMLDAFGVHGRFTLTTNFAEKDGGHPQKHGIRIRSHSHCGVELQIQPDPGTSTFYTSWLKQIEPPITSDALAMALHAKMAGTRYFLPEKWRDPQKWVTLPSPASETPHEPVSVTGSTDSVEHSDAGGEAESLRGYSSNEDDRNLILIGVYERHGGRPFTSDEFVRTVQGKCSIKASVSSIKGLLRRLTKQGFFDSRSSGPIEAFTLSTPIIDYLVESGLIVRGSESESRIQTQAIDITPRILELSHQAEQYRSAVSELGFVDDEIKLAESDLRELDAFRARTERKLESLKKRREEVVSITKNPVFVEAGKNLATLLQNHTG